MKNYVSPNVTVKKFTEDVVKTSDNFIVDDFDDSPEPTFYS